MAHGKDATRDIEQKILGAMLTNANYAAEIRQAITHEDFRDKDTGEEFRRICDVLDRKENAAFALREHCELRYGVSGPDKLPQLFLAQVKRLKIARWQAAKLATVGRHANPADPAECEELWLKFQKDMQPPA